MRKAEEDGRSPLLAAVQALDEELTRFAELAASAERVPLTSERNLDKAARIVNDAAASQARVGDHIQALIEAIGAARAQPDAVAAELVQTRDAVQARGERYQARLGRFAALGQRAADVSQKVKQLGALKGRPNAEVVGELGGVLEQMNGVVADATTLGKEAETDRMEDLARQCDSVRQQVHSAANKVTLLRDKLSSTIG